MFGNSTSRESGWTVFGKPNNANYEMGKKCCRIVKDETNRDIQKALSYFKLRTDGCPAKESLSFCTRRICKVDSTRIKDGPPNHRTLSVCHDPKLLSYNGWIYDIPDYIINEEKKISIKNFMDMTREKQANQMVIVPENLEADDGILA